MFFEEADHVIDRDPKFGMIIGDAEIAFKATKYDYLTDEDINSMVYHGDTTKCSEEDKKPI